MVVENTRVLTSLDEPTFASLLRVSVDEGYTFVQKLADEFASGVNRFDVPGVLLAVYQGETMIAVGGVHPDPYLPGEHAGRIRHVYVLPDQRRSGVGRRLLGALIDHARGHFEVLTLRTPTAHAAAFYKALGFDDQPRFADATHWMSLKTDLIR